MGIRFIFLSNLLNNTQRNYPISCYLSLFGAE
uniref:Uncharacterized protein n=1 Tax=Rhizophora mucronata TaxID=61149 RepID=A0A2P2QR37_RHIMU